MTETKIQIKTKSSEQTQMKIPIHKKTKDLKTLSQSKIILPHGHSWVDVITTIPNEIQMNTELFERIWNLHPEELGSGMIAGQPVTFKRWEQSYGHDYYYAGKLHVALPLETDPYLTILLEWVCKHSGLQYKGLLINWYQDGNHYIGPHADSEASLIKESPIYSFSFGQDRDFVIKSKDKTHRQVIHMNDGSLIIMGGEMQKYYKHSVPVRALSKCPKRRINMTFRLFK
jgi:alkylated DNA repair dioxygenase AlkB